MSPSVTIVSVCHRLSLLSSCLTECVTVLTECVTVFDRVCHRVCPSVSPSLSECITECVTVSVTECYRVWHLVRNRVVPRVTVSDRVTPCLTHIWPCYTVFDPYLTDFTRFMTGLWRFRPISDEFSWISMIFSDYWPVGAPGGVSQWCTSVRTAITPGTTTTTRYHHHPYTDGATACTAPLVGSPGSFWFQPVGHITRSSKPEPLKVKKITVLMDFPCLLQVTIRSQLSKPSF